MEIDRLEPAFHRLVDLIFAYLPQPRPSAECLKNCRIVSHRGQHDNRKVMENSLPAFSAARSHGVWGIELDIRWTGDLLPVVLHDPDLWRFYRTPQRICDLTLAELRSRFPLIPSLEEVIAGFGGDLHLMIEIKKEKRPEPQWQGQILADLLSPLTPGRDFHLLALDPEVFDALAHFPSATFLPIARLAFRRFSELALTRRYGGLTGHYLFITRRMISRHRRSMQKIGTGFVSSRNALFRELNRGVDWIFSNDAAKLQALCGGKKKML
jgi:glycerophosphoryl diester phosphodiesterase